MIISDICIRPREDRRLEVCEILQTILGPMRSSPGCLRCRICEENDDERAIIFTEEWESEEQFHDHVRSEYFNRILGALELSRTPPKVSIFTVTEVEGFELIERLRKQETAPTLPPKQST